VVQTWDLSEQDRQAEALFLGLRLMKGISLAEFNESFGTDVRAQHGEDFERFVEAGLIEELGDSIRLTRTGALLSNEVFAAFI
jgi:oxygen-independent coproporphyrinogen-3 oxidase